MNEKVINQDFLVLSGIKESILLGIDSLEQLGFQLVEDTTETQIEQCHPVNTTSHCIFPPERISDGILFPITNRGDEPFLEILDDHQNCLGLVHRDELEDEQKTVLDSMLKEEFRKFDTTTNCTDLTEHRIILKINVPIRQRYFPKNPIMREIIYKQVDQLLEKKLIEPSASSYCSPIVLVKKKDDSWRMCID